MISYQGEDVEERENGEEICKSWSEVETLTTAEQDRDADQIACGKCHKIYIVMQKHL